MKQLEAILIYKRVTGCGLKQASDRLRSIAWHNLDSIECDNKVRHVLCMGLESYVSEMKGQVATLLESLRQISRDEPATVSEMKHQAATLLESSERAIKKEEE